jgi:Bacterial Ig-like domain (group 3)
MLAGIAACLSAASADGAAQFAWSGQATSPNWSQATDWAGGSAPSGSVGMLTFPALTGPGCTSSPQTATCYQSNNDQSGLTTAGISIDDGAGYDITGNALTVGPGGISAAPSPNDPSAPNDRFSVLDVPITLGGPQTWSITGGSPNQQLLALGAVSDANDDPFAITLQDNAGLTFQDAEVGPVSVLGEGAAPNGVIKLGYFNDSGALVGGSLNASDANPVSVTSGAGVFALDGTIAPLTVTDGLIQLGQADHAGTLTVDQSATLDQQSALVTFINGPGTTSGTDYSELTTSGTMDLGDATLALEDGEIPGSNACELLTPGDVDTLVAATGGLTGQFSGIPDGTTVPLICPGSGGTPPTATINYDDTAATVTATIANAGTPGAATTTTLSATPSSGLVTNQPVTLTATVSASAATPDGTVEFYNDVSGNTAPISGCDAQPVSEVQPVPPSGPSYTATCQTSFVASQTANLSAAFSPANGSRVAASTTSGLVLSIALATTTTAVTVAPTQIGNGQPALMTATVTPSQAGPTTPSGTITFLVDGQPVPAGGGGTGCTNAPVAAGLSSATAECSLQFENLTGTSTHAITASYTGDPNFSASTSQPQTLTAVGSAPPTPSKICQAHLGHASVSVIKIDVVVTCKGTKGQRATVSLELSAREKSKAKAKTASGQGTKVKSTTHAVVVGEKTFSLGADQGETVHVTLDASAVRTLLKARKLAVTLTATQNAADGTTRLVTQKLAFKAHCATTWAKLKICRSSTKRPSAATKATRLVRPNHSPSRRTVSESITSQAPFTAADMPVGPN